MEIIKDASALGYEGCDVIVRLSEDRRTTPIKLLQLTDIQIIDASQVRVDDRLRIDEINAWQPDAMDINVFNHIKSLIAQTKPDMIFITGDMVYGSFDDLGTTMVRFCVFMDSLGIPWAPVFGNHDNETHMGVDWQCDMLENSKNCLFCRGEVSGNGNYTVGIAVGEELVRVMHMLDSHGCLAKPGLFPDQLDMVRNNTKLLRQSQGKNIPAFVCLHYPTEEFIEAAMAKGYETDGRTSYTIGVEVEAKDDDFGAKYQNYKKQSTIPVPGFKKLVKECCVDAVFAGHYHTNNTCITYDNIKWVCGLKTGQYDYHTPGQLGGTLVVLENETIKVSHVPALVKFAPFVSERSVFEDFFAPTTHIVK